MSIEPTIREATPADAAELTRLCVELGYAATADEMAQRLAAVAQWSDQHVLVAAAAAGDLSGWIAVQRRLILEAGEFAEVVGLVVSTGAQRGGAGRALVAAAEGWARRQGLDVVCVRSNVARDAAHPFYERLGYRRAKTQHVYEKHLDAE